MDLANLIVLISLAFGLGMLHALDADHVMAVSGLMAGQQQKRKNIAFCLRWALGHGGVLVLLGMAIFLFGLQLPASISQYAELSVGIILILIGGLLFIDLYRMKAHLHFHHHDGLPAHAHWHVHKKSERSSNRQHQHDHAAILVGIVHGLAGSAPLLALVPVSMMHSPVYGLVYLLVFSAGVLCAMLLFGGIFSYVQEFTCRQGVRAIKLLRFFTGAGAILSGMLVIHGVQL